MPVEERVKGSTVTSEMSFEGWLGVSWWARGKGHCWERETGVGESRGGDGGGGR